MEGNEKIGTSIGCLFSIFTLIIVLSQVVVRGAICVTKARPFIAQSTVENARTSNDKIDLDEYNFHIGFGVRNANDEYERHDPNYVEFVPILEEKLKNESHSTYHPLKYHKCTEEDYAKFSTVRD